MARQKSEDRVLLEGGVMPAERSGSSPGAQGKAIPVEQTAGQLACRSRQQKTRRGPREASVDQFADARARVPEAIVNAESVTPVTMEEVVSRLSAALLKVVSNKGAPGRTG